MLKSSVVNLHVYSNETRFWAYETNIAVVHAEVMDKEIQSNKILSTQKMFVISEPSSRAI